jgi:hypothetical protein
MLLLVKMLKNMSCTDSLAEDTDQWLAVLSMLRNLRVP